MHVDNPTRRLIQLGRGGGRRRGRGGNRMRQLIPLGGGGGRGRGSGSGSGRVSSKKKPISDYNLRPRDSLIPCKTNNPSPHNAVVLADTDITLRKLRVCGLDLETTSASLRSVFAPYGELKQALVINDYETRKSTGYGLVIYKHADSALLALKEPSKVIDGRITVCGLAKDCSTSAFFVDNRNAGRNVDRDKARLVDGHELIYRLANGEEVKPGDIAALVTADTQDDVAKPKVLIRGTFGSSGVTASGGNGQGMSLSAQAQGSGDVGRLEVVKSDQQSSMQGSFASLFGSGGPCVDSFNGGNSGGLGLQGGLAGSGGSFGYGVLGQGPPLGDSPHPLNLNSGDTLVKMVAAQLDDETVNKVIRQVEFYFSDSNILRDTFLRNTINKSEDGMVSLALICSFSRMRGHLGLGEVKADDVPEDTVEAVAETIKTKSTTLKISEDGKKVGRTTELRKPEEVIEQLDSRTIAASPIEYDTTLEEVETFFNQSAKVTSVRLPRHVADKRIICGTALVEFSSDEDATNILTKSLVFKGAELELKPKKEFDEQRALDEEAECTHRETLVNRKNGSQEEEYPKGLIVAFKLKSTSAENDNQVKSGDAKPDSMELETEKESEPKAEAGNDNQVKSGEVKPDSMELETEKESEPKADAKASSEAEDNKHVVLRKDLKSVFEKFGTVKYIDFKMGEESGYIRFEEADASQKARAAAVLTEEGGLVVKNYVAIIDSVTGDAEKEYWTMLRSQEKSRGNNRGNWSRGGKNNNRGGRRFNGKPDRSRDNNGGGRPNKFQKVAAA